MTREDITAILLEAKEVEIDMRPPYLEEMARKPYPTNYIPPIFPKYDDVVGNAKKHIRRYVDALIAHSYEHELRLKKFSKSLEGHACT